MGDTIVYQYFNLDGTLSYSSNSVYVGYVLEERKNGDFYQRVCVLLKKHCDFYVIGPTKLISNKMVLTEKFDFKREKAISRLLSILI